MSANWGCPFSDTDPDHILSSRAAPWAAGDGGGQEPEWRVPGSVGAFEVQLVLLRG